MALLFMDGFGSNEFTHKWDPQSNATVKFVSTNTSPRTPGGFYTTGSVGSLYKTITPSGRIFCGFGFRTANMNTPFVSFYGDNGVSQHITVVRSDTSGFLEIRRGDRRGTLLASGSRPLAPAQWNYVEVSVTISDTVGEVHVRLNGAITDEISYIGDTKNGGTATMVDRVQLYTGDGATYSTDFSDVYVLNDGGTINNDFLGDVVVRTLPPVGNGTYSQLVGSDGNSVDNYQLVDEWPFSATDYVSSATAGDKDTYQMADLPSGVTTIYGMQLNGMMSKSDASLASARYVLRSGGADYTGVTLALTTTPTGYYELYETDPATSSSWTPIGINNVEAGMEVQ